MRTPDGVEDMETVYIETSVVSLLVANPSPRLVMAARQRATRDWWDLRRIRRGWMLPTVCTPLELMGDSSDEIEFDS